MDEINSIVNGDELFGFVGRWSRFSRICGVGHCVCFSMHEIHP